MILAEYLCFQVACFDAYKPYLGLFGGLLQRTTFPYYFWVIQRVFSSLFYPSLLNRDAGVHSLLCFSVFKYSLLPITFWSHLLSQSLWVESITVQTPSKAEKFCGLQDPFVSYVSFCMQSIHTRLCSEWLFVQELVRTEQWKSAETLFFISDVSLTPPNPYLMTCCSCRALALRNRQRFTFGNIIKHYIIMQFCTENCLLFITVLWIHIIKNQHVCL